MRFQINGFISRWGDSTGHNLKHHPSPERKDTSARICRRWLHKIGLRPMSHLAPPRLTIPRESSHTLLCIGSYNHLQQLRSHLQKGNYSLFEQSWQFDEFATLQRLHYINRLFLKSADLKMWKTSNQTWRLLAFQRGSDLNHEHQPSLDTIIDNAATLTIRPPTRLYSKVFGGILYWRGLGERKKEKCSRTTNRTRVATLTGKHADRSASWKCHTRGATWKNYLAIDGVLIKLPLQFIFCQKSSCWSCDYVAAGLSRIACLFMKEQAICHRRGGKKIEKRYASRSETRNTSFSKTVGGLRQGARPQQDIALVPLR